MVRLVAQAYTHHDGSCSIEPQGWHVSDSVVATQHHHLLLNTQLQFMIADMPVTVPETRIGNCISHIAGDMK